MDKEKGSRVLGFLIVTLWLMLQVYLLNKTFTDFSKSIESEHWREVAEFLVFSVQLLLGGFAYDILRALSMSDKSWDALVKTFKDTFICFFVVLVCLIALGNPNPSVFLKSVVAFFAITQLVYAVSSYKKFLLEVNKHFKKD